MTPLPAIERAQIAEALLCLGPEASAYASELLLEANELIIAGHEREGNGPIIVIGTAATVLRSLETYGEA